MTSGNLTTGKIGESLATRYLQNKGFKILHKNYRHGKTEIDIIAEKQKKIHFIEVKTRTSIIKGKPYEAVRKWKIAHLLTTATFFLLQSGKKRNRLSLDVISIVLDSQKRISTIDHYLNVHI